jgi:hypothetical protein
MSDLRYDWAEVHKVYEDFQEESFIALHGLLGALALLIARYEWPKLDFTAERTQSWCTVRRQLKGDDRIRFDTLIPYEQGRSGTYAYPTLVDDYRNEFEYVYHKKPRPLVGTERLD